MLQLLSSSVHICLDCISWPLQSGGQRVLVQDMQTHWLLALPLATSPGYVQGVRGGVLLSLS